jgi:two-component system OmpR family sensor kinase
MSLRARLWVGLAFVAAVLGLTTYLVTRTTSQHLVRQLDNQLSDLTQSRHDRFGDKPFGEDDQPSTFYYAELSSNGSITVRLHPNLDGDHDADDLPALDADEIRSATIGEAFTVGADHSSERWRVLVTQGPGHLEISALSMSDVDETVRRLVLVEVIAGAGMLGALALVGWWVIRLGVRPIKQMTTVATDIAAGDLSHRVPDVKESTEAGQLGVALNQMLGTIEEAFDERTRSEERLKQFVADASHELRTPIATVRGYAELYRRGGLDAKPEMDDAMRRTEQEAIRMGGLVEDLLQLARLDQGRPLDRAPVALDRLAADAVNDARAMAPGRQITASVVTPVVVLGDEPKLRQVIANLVANARVHTPPSSAIDVRVTREGDRAVLEVADQGPGMAPETAARAFERFYRADKSRSRHAGGSGLGLSIVKGTIEALGGTVSLTSTPDRGTTVRMTLPVALVGPPAPVRLEPTARDHG